MPRPIARLTLKLLVRVVLCAAFLAPLRPFLQRCISRQKPLSHNSITTPFCFINIASRLKKDMILVQPAQASTSEPPPVLSPAFNTFLAAACSISPTQANHAWALLQDVIWHGAIDKDLSSVWVKDAPRRGFGMFT
ncbi:hypothetical protein EV424DRAFT_1541359 [Suillus variegatus]|nr:hypothetical protein EV424DRAFT_1541359 [Suillus variegatus]